MQSLGLGELKTDLDALKPHKQTPSKRGVSSKRSRAAAEPVRRSTRHKGGVDGGASGVLFAVFGSVEIDACARVMRGCRGAGGYAGAVQIGCRGGSG